MSRHDAQPGQHEQDDQHKTMVALNLGYLARSAFEGLEPPANRPFKRRRDQSEPVLVSVLPSSDALEREARRKAVKTLRHATIAQQVATAVDEHIGSPVTQSEVPHGAWDSRGADPVLNASTAPAKRTFQFHQILQAIERKDIVTLMEARDSDFRSLVESRGGLTPLLYASRIGPSHRDVAILLVGALSRFVNHLDDEQLAQARISPDLQALLRAIRSNLRLAISSSLATSQTDLVASYLQLLCMTEGKRFVLEGAGKVALACRSGQNGLPVACATDLVRRFVGKQLESADMIAAAEDYLNNAILDLLLMGAWNVVTDSVQGDAIPHWLFGRDDRVFRCFVGNLEAAEREPRWARVPKTIKSTCRTLTIVIESRTVGNRQKVEELKRLLDGA